MPARTSSRSLYSFDRKAGRKARRSKAHRQSRRTARSLSRTSSLYLGELKGMDTSLAITGPVIDTTDTNGDAIVLNLIRQGTGSWERIGKKVGLHSVRLSGIAQYSYLDTATTGVVAGTVLRMVVVWDSQPSGTLPAFADIFGRTAQDGTETTEILDPVRYDNMDRFSILRDVRIAGNPPLFNGAAGNSDVTELKYPFDEYIKLNKTSVYSGQSAPMTIADVSTGGLYVYFRADESVAGTRDWSIEDQSLARLRFSS